MLAGHSFKVKKFRAYNNRSEEFIIIMMIYKKKKVNSYVSSKSNKCSA